ncbi:hypothetical protein BC938DRAFT_481784 [Jimgerdemannia flammicorona]|nr:hypothetical protein BC938DRAFT_481784 [Jimgerdemannia flammicorona]
MNDRSGQAYLLGGNTVDFSTTIVDLASLNATLSPMNTKRNVSISGVCVSALNYIYIVGGDIVWPLSDHGGIGISVFDLNSAAWVAPLTIPITTGLYLAATTQAPNSTVWLILYDETTSASIGVMTWCFYNLAQPNIPPISITISVGAQISGTFTSMIVQANIVYLFGNPTVFSVNLAPLFANPTSTAVLSLKPVIFRPSDSQTTAAPIPQGQGQAVAIAAQKIGFFSYTTNSIIIFDTQTMSCTTAFPFPSSAAGTVDFYASTLVALPTSISSTPVLIMYNAANSTFASFDLTTNRWRLPASSNGSSNYEAFTPPCSSDCSAGLEHNGLPLGAIIGGAVGGAVLFIIVIAFLCWARNNGRSKIVTAAAADIEPGNDVDRSHELRDGTHDEHESTHDPTSDERGRSTHSLSSGRYGNPFVANNQESEEGLAKIINELMDLPTKSAPRPVGRLSRSVSAPSGIRLHSVP